MRQIFIISILSLCTLTVMPAFAEDGIMADEPGTSITLPFTLTGVWVNPTDNSMENGLSVLSEPWPSYSGSLITYIDLYDPAYGLDSTKSYRMTNIAFCIKDKGNYNGVESSRVIIQEWFNGWPTETNLFNEEFDTSGWGFPPDYAWTDPMAITDTSFVLPAEFAIGWHIHWPTSGAFADYWFGLDEDAPTGNFYYYNDQWLHMSPYDGAFGIMFEVEEYGSSNLESASFGEIKAIFQ